MLLLAGRGRVASGGGGGGGGSGFTPNLPSGMTLVADSSFESFTDTTASSSTTDGIEVINWTSNITEDAASFGVRSSTNNSGLYGSKSIRCWFPGNHAGDGVGPMTLSVGLDGTEHYMACHMRFDSNYVFHTNGEKFFYPVENVSGEGNWGASLLNVGGGGQFVGMSGPIQTAPVTEGKSAADVVPLGPWFLAEFYVKLNTPGNSDGIWQAWIDDVQVFSTTSWQFSNNGSTQMQFALGRRDTTRGGGTSSVLTPAGGTWLEIDRLAFYKR